jgi:hypothetical protein
VILLVVENEAAGLALEHEKTALQWASKLIVQRNIVIVNV